MAASEPHRYSAKDLSRGSKALKGKDAHIVAIQAPIAEEMGFVLLLASQMLVYSVHSCLEADDFPTPLTPLILFIVVTVRS